MQICIAGWIYVPVTQTYESVFKLGDGVGLNHCRVKKVDVISTFIENIFRSGLSLVSS